MRKWIEAALEQCPLTADVEGYLLSRGAKPETIATWKARTWECPEEPAPDPTFQERYGPHGEFFEDRAIMPLYSPLGKVLGWDSRATVGKKASRYMIGDDPWSPVFLGLLEALEKIWAGRAVYLVEGFADVFALQHAFPDDAILGTGPARLTYSQAEFLRRFAKYVYIAYDNDPTGDKGAEKALKDLRFRRVECERLKYGRTGDDPGAIWTMGGLDSIRKTFHSLL